MGGGDTQRDRETDMERNTEGDGKKTDRQTQKMAKVGGERERGKQVENIQGVKGKQTQRDGEGDKDGGGRREKERQSQGGGGSGEEEPKEAGSPRELGGPVGEI